MSLHLPSEDADVDENAPFERNNYFHGKLMTARDMQTEQAYHRRRLNTVSGHVLGRGLVTGLQTELTETDTRLEATMKPGVAVAERPIVITGEGGVGVKRDSTGEMKLPSGEEIYLYLTPTEYHTERVPKPSSSDEFREDCDYNRVVESFELRYTDRPKTEFKSVPEVTLPEGADDGEREGDYILGQMTREYYDERSAGLEPDVDSPLPLGRFVKEDGKWERDPDWNRHAFVYSNDMLAAFTRVIAERVTSFEAVQSVGGVHSSDIELDSDDETIVITTLGDEDDEWVNLDVSERVVLRDALDDEVEELNAQVEDLNEHIDRLERRLDRIEEREEEDPREDETDVDGRNEQDDPSDDGSEDTDEE